MKKEIQNRQEEKGGKNVKKSWRQRFNQKWSKAAVVLAGISLLAVGVYASTNNCLKAAEKTDTTVFSAETSTDMNESQTVSSDEPMNSTSETSTDTTLETLDSETSEDSTDLSDETSTTSSTQISTIDSETVYASAEKDGVTFSNLPDEKQIPVDTFYRQSEFKPENNETIAEKALKVIGVSPDDFKNVIVKDKTTGEILPITFYTDITVDGVFPVLPSIGVEVTTSAGEKVQYPWIKVPVYPDSVIPPESEMHVLVGDEANTVTITNPINQSKIGFANKGVTTGIQQPFSWIAIDASRKSYIYDNNSFADLPYIDGVAQRYGTINGTGTQKNFYYGVNWMPIDPANNWNTVNTKSLNRLTHIFYLKSSDGKHVRAVTALPAQNIFYYYDLSLKPNLNFEATLSMVNVSEGPRTFSMLQSVDTMYYDDHVPIYSLANNSGFYMLADKQKPPKKFSIKFKNDRGDWLSDFTMYDVQNYSKYVINGLNYFNNDFTNPGNEIQNLKAGDVIIQGVDSAFQAGAPPKEIKPTEALKTGYQLFVGNEIPYMQLLSQPNLYSVYDTINSNFVTDYTLSKIPPSGETGKVYVTYPDQEQEFLTDFTADPTDHTFKGTWTIQRNKLPKELLANGENHKAYELPMFAVVDKEGIYKDLPSDYYAVTINVYRLGATAIGQSIKVGSTWNKAAAAVLTDQSFMPSHENQISYTYVDQDGNEIKNLADVVDTTEEGLQWINVKMTDSDPDNGDSTIIKVPVTILGDEMVVKDNLVLQASDFTTSPDAVKDMDESVLHQFILNNAQAKAWLISTGTDVKDIQVSNTNLTNMPESSKAYTATLTAKEGNLKVEKTINIVVTESAGTLELGVPDELTFESVTVPLPKKEERIVPRIKEDTDWTITVNDTMENPGDWTLQAQLTKLFTNGDDVIGNLLIFQPDEGEAVEIGEANQPIYTPSTPTQGVNELSWAKDKGFLLRLDQQTSTKIKAGKYTAEMTFTFADDSI